MAVTPNGADANHYTRTASVPTKSPLTIRAWVKRTSDPNTTHAWFLLRNATGNTQHLACRFSPDGDSLNGFTNSTSTDTNVDTLTDGAWHHVVYTYDASVTTLKIYVDGSLAYTNTSQQAQGSGASDTLYLLRMNTGAAYLRGELSSVAIWTEVLDSTKVAADYSYLVPQYTTNLWAFWRLASATDTADTSGNSRTLTKVGTPTTGTDPTTPEAPTDATPVSTGRGAAEALSVHGGVAAAVCTGRGHAQATAQHDATAAAVTTGRGDSLVAPSGAFAVADGTGRGAAVATCSHGLAGAPATTGRGTHDATMGHGYNLAALTTGRGAVVALLARGYLATPETTGRGSVEADGTHQHFIRAEGTGRGVPVAVMRADSNNVQGTGRGNQEATHTTSREAAGATTGRGGSAATCSHGLAGDGTGTGRGTNRATSTPGGILSPLVTGRGHARALASRNQDGSAIGTGRGNAATTGRAGAIGRAAGTGRGGQAAAADATHPSRPQVQGRGTLQAVTSKGIPSSVNSTGRGAGSATHSTERAAAVTTTGRGGQAVTCARAAEGSPLTTGTGTSQISGPRNQDGAPVTTGRGVPRSYATQSPITIGAHQLSLAALVAAFRTNDVAHAAECDVGLWTSATAPRVYDSERGYIASRHRGRLPFVEIAKAVEGFTQRASDLGNEPTRWVVLVHVGGLNVRAAETRARAILATGLAALRADGYTWLGDAEAAAMAKDPLGYVLACGIELLHTYDPRDHNVVLQGEP